MDTNDIKHFVAKLLHNEDLETKEKVLKMNEDIIDLFKNSPHIPHRNEAIEWMNECQSQIAELIQSERTEKQMSADVRVLLIQRDALLSLVKHVQDPKNDIPAKYLLSAASNIITAAYRLRDDPSTTIEKWHKLAHHAENLDFLDKDLNVIDLSKENLSQGDCIFFGQA